jgi:hypothetical protein
MSKPTYIPPYKFKGPKLPENYYDMVCPYTVSPPGTIMFDNVPVKPKYPEPRNGMQKNLRSGKEN